MLGVKTSYGVSLLIRNEPESAKLSLYQKYVPDIQEALPLAKEDLPSKRGQLTPMEVMDAPLRAGDLLHGYQAVADNLPNNPRIHKAKGTKKIFFKNFMDARVNYVILPLAKDLMPESQASRASAEGYLASTVLHEICHGLLSRLRIVSSRSCLSRSSKLFHCGSLTLDAPEKIVFYPSDLSNPSNRSSS